MGRISALTELTTLASDDYLVVLDSSANIAKKITIANAFGIADFGWTASGESWTYASWSATTRIGTITVPTDATTKYYEGMRIKITQATGGTKYGIIHDVAATLLTVFFPSGTTFNNEAITSPFYSIGDTPLGFPKSITFWQLTAEKVATSAQASPTNSTWYNLGSFSLTVGKGAWLIEALFAYQIVSIEINTTLSTANNTVGSQALTNRDYESGGGTRLHTCYRSEYKDHTGDVTYYMNAMSSTSATTMDTRGASGHAAFIRATSKYL